MQEKFDPNNFAPKNGNFIGLPFTKENAKVILLPVPWEATVSYSDGCAMGPENILEASYQLDLVDWNVPKAWETSIFMCPVSKTVLEWSEECRELAKAHIDRLEQQEPVDKAALDKINNMSKQLNDWVYQTSKAFLEQNKKIGLVGGEHSTPFGYIKALSEKYPDFGILQIDAHCDLRQAYEGFEYSHASIFYNVMEQIPAVSQLVQVAIRDVCPAELQYAAERPNRIAIHSMHSIRKEQFQQNISYHEHCQKIISTLPQQVYISFDIDGLDPKLCPNTGTPVPGGLEFEEAFYLIQQVLDSGREIIGFDLSEVGSASEWDGNVGARALYKLAVALGNC